MAREEQDRRGDIRFVIKTTIADATTTSFTLRGLQGRFLAQNTFKENDRIKITIERMVSDEDESSGPSEARRETDKP